MLIAEKITARIIAYCFVAVLFLFANHCFLEDACASLGKVDLGGHPVKSSNTDSAPCHEHSTESESKGKGCPIIGISLHKTISASQDLQDNLNSNFKILNWVFTLSQAPVYLPQQVKVTEEYRDHFQQLSNAIIILNSASQAPPYK